MQNYKLMLDYKHDVWSLYRDYYMALKGLATALEMNNILKALPVVRAKIGNQKNGDTNELLILGVLKVCLKICFKFQAENTKETSVFTGEMPDIIVASFLLEKVLDALNSKEEREGFLKVYKLDSKIESVYENINSYKVILKPEVQLPGQRRIEEIIPNEYSKTDDWEVVGKTYMFIYNASIALGLKRTEKALKFVLTLFEGKYRKTKVVKHRKEYKIPYVLHCLEVAGSLVALRKELHKTQNQLDDLFCAALLHDCVEDFPKVMGENGEKIMDEFGMRVHKIVMLCTKQSGYSWEQLYQYFKKIAEDEDAILVKIADRANNVQTIHAIKDTKKYINETRVFFLEHGICDVCKTAYPSLSNVITILKNQINALVDEAETLILSHEEEMKKVNEENESLNLQLKRLQEENERLKQSSHM